MKEYKWVDVTEECELRFDRNDDGYMVVAEHDDIDGPFILSDMAFRKRTFGDFRIVPCEVDDFRIEKRIEVEKPEPFKCPLEHPEDECPVLTVPKPEPEWIPEIGDEVAVDFGDGDTADSAFIVWADGDEYQVFAPRPDGSTWHSGFNCGNPVPGMPNNHLFIEKEHMTLIKKVAK